MGTRNRPNTSHRSDADAYGPEAELVAALAERNFREAAAKRAEREAADAVAVQSEAAARAAELDERERALEAREQLIRALEARLEDSRRRLEERLEQVRYRAPGVASATFKVPSVDHDYFSVGSNVDEETWWRLQLGLPPKLAA